MLHIPIDSDDVVHKDSDWTLLLLPAIWIDLPGWRIPTLDYGGNADCAILISLKS